MVMSEVFWLAMAWHSYRSQVLRAWLFSLFGRVSNYETSLWRLIRSLFGISGDSSQTSCLSRAVVGAGLGLLGYYYGQYKKEKKEERRILVFLTLAWLVFPVAASFKNSNIPSYNNLYSCCYGVFLLLIGALVTRIRLRSLCGRNLSPHGGRSSGNGTHASIRTSVAWRERVLQIRGTQFSCFSGSLKIKADMGYRKSDFFSVLRNES